jgi:hypothetical protein
MKSKFNLDVSGSSLKDIYVSFKNIQNNFLELEEA